MKQSKKHKQYLRMRLMSVKYRTKLARQVVASRNKTFKTLPLKGKTIAEAKKVINSMPVEKDLIRVFRQMYSTLGFDTAKTQYKLFVGEQKEDENVLEADWLLELDIFASQYAGVRIKTLNKTMKKDLLKILDRIVVDAVSEGTGIERLTDEIVKRVGKDFYKNTRWMARRIAHTEASHCASKAQSISVDSLGIGYNKVWQITGINTRPSHRALQGRKAKKGKPFTLSDGSKVMYPSDSSMNASPGEVINCSCFLIYEPL